MHGERFEQSGVTKGHKVRLNILVNWGDVSHTSTLSMSEFSLCSQAHVTLYPYDRLVGTKRSNPISLYGAAYRVNVMP